MPILHVQFAAEGVKPDASKVQIPPAAALQARGPVIQASVSLAQAMAQQLLQQGIPLPSPVSGIALIDTGASHTCIDAESAQAMNLPVIDVVKMAYASHDATDQNVYPIQIELAGLPITIQAPRAIGAALKPQGLLLLIGRDLLQHCALTYNGMAGTITLAI